MSDEQITKRRVTMRNVSFNQATGETRTETATDYVRPDFLDAYVADAKQRWQYVEVSDEVDAGPGGYHGQTHVPDALDHELSGQTFEATTPSKEK